MRNFWTLIGVMLVVVAAGIALTACSSPTPESPPAPETPQEPAAPAEPAPGDTDAAAGDDPSTEGQPASAVTYIDIDIGDITYGVYANIELLPRDDQPNFDVQRLSSPRFDHRTQLLTVNVSPPYPDVLPLSIIFASTRPLTGHSVITTVHAFREYEDANGDKVVEEILTFERVLGYNRILTHEPDIIPLNPFGGLEQLPETMLVYCEVEAWLYLNTHPDTIDLETTSRTGVDYKRYPGFNPARINLMGGGSAE